MAGLNDSKQVNERDRKRWFGVLTSGQGIEFGVGIVTAEEVACFSQVASVSICGAQSDKFPSKNRAAFAFQQAMRNVSPQMEVKPRRVGGATYQVPVEIRADRRNALAIRWLLTAARARKGVAMAQRLAAEIEDAYHNNGAAVKRREDTHRMAEANRAFVHYRW